MKTSLEGGRRKTHLSRKHLAIIALVVILAVTNVAFAVLYMTKSVNISGGVQGVGTIEVYDEDGVTPLTSYDFPLFTAGTSDTYFKDFFINNTGDQPVYVYWNVSSSSINWYIASDGSGYHCDEGSIHKYGFGIEIGYSEDYWMPKEYTTPEALYLGVDEGQPLSLLLVYYGQPSTAETFSLVMSFYAQDA